MLPHWLKWAEQGLRICQGTTPWRRRSKCIRARWRLSAVIEGVTESDRLTEVGDWVINCDTEAEFLAHLQPRS